MDIQQYRRGERGVVDVQRAENWAAMYHAGLTLQQIGDRSGVSRERVRQVLRRIKVASHEGGAAMRKTALRDRRAPATASEIAAGAGVPRSYVGGLAQHLISKAAVRRIEGRPVRYEALQ